MFASGLIVISTVLAAKITICLAIYSPSMHHNYKSECLDELDIRFSHDPRETTCLTKCIYEKEARLDSDGNFDLSKMSFKQLDIPETCLNLINTTNICFKAQLLDDCLTHKANQYSPIHKECDEYIHYNDESIGKVNHCYNRCINIVDGELYENGKVNTSELNYPKNTLDQVIERCNKFVVDEDDCVRDLNIYYCVMYILRESPEELENRMECGKENKAYPFGGVDPAKSTACYDRCVLIKTGELDEKNLVKSESFKKLNISENEIQEYYNTCKSTMNPTDECNEDLYIYDCINMLKNSDSVYVKNLKECAQETKSPLLLYRDSDQQNYCLDRCLMIKENKLDKEGVVNRTHLRHLSVNATILNESISECNQYIKNKSCEDNVNTYYCINEKIRQKVLKLCRNISNPDIFRSITSMAITICSRRCYMINNGELTPTGEINFDSVQFVGKNVTVIEDVIKTCKEKVVSSDECARDVHRFFCVTSLLN